MSVTLNVVIPDRVVSGKHYAKFNRGLNAYVDNKWLEHATKIRQSLEKHKTQRLDSFVLRMLSIQ